jgi:hypothetical protein
LVSKEIADKLEELSEKYKTPLEEVTKKFEEVRNDPKRVSISLDEDDADKRALNMTGLLVRRKAVSKTEDFVGFFCAVGRLVDNAAIQRRIAEKAWKANPVEAVRKGLVDKDGNPLENRKNFRTKGQPLPEHDYSRLSMGVCSKDGTEEDPHQFRLYSRRNQAKDNPPPMFQWLRFNVIDKTKENSIMPTYSTSKYTEYKPVELDVPIEEGMMVFLQDNEPVPLPELSAAFEAARRAGRKRAFVVTQGLVSDLDLNVKKWSQNDPEGYITMQIYDVDMPEDEIGYGGGVRVRVPEHVPIDFARNSEVIVIGSLSKADRLDTKTNTWVKGEGGWQIDAYGVWGIPGLSIAPEEQPEEEAVDDILEELDGDLGGLE